MKNLTYKLTFAVIVGMMLATLFILMQKPWQASGSIAIAESYYATSTVDTINWASATAIKVLKVGGGQLGSIVVGSSSPATVTYPSMKCYDSSVSTTTASSTLITIGSGASNGTYQVDSAFKAGLICEAPAGFIGGYTVTWK